VQQIGELLKRPQRDAANLPAIVLDALQGLIYRDDRQVVELEVITDLTS
jgi:Holliday junction resolvase RusA-like endonuclease